MDHMGMIFKDAKVLNRFVWNVFGVFFLEHLTPLTPHKGVSGETLEEIPPFGVVCLFFFFRGQD